jgi:hypothetical protein
VRLPALTGLQVLRHTGSGRRADDALVPAALSAAFLLRYVRRVGSGYRAAAADPSPQRLQRAVGTAVLGSVELQAGLLAGAGAVPQAVAAASARPIATALARRRGVS